MKRKQPSQIDWKLVHFLDARALSLVAVALLFSVFRARPSPFYLLDEVEPALDDVNLHRFLEIAAEFRDRSQLLIVTHQKRTMEIAKMLYGVSMSKDGTTKVVCQTMADPKAKVPDSPADLVPEADPVA